MARLACVDVPFFPLQVLFRKRPEWKELPAAVVDRDEATGRVLSINEAARRKGVRPGISYSQALSLAGGLRAATVEPALIEEARLTVIEVLSTFTPSVEPCRPGGDDADGEGGKGSRGPAGGRDRVGGLGSFWVNVGGLEMLYPSLSMWMSEAAAALGGEGFLAVAAVGFTRFGSYVVARARRKSTVLTSEKQEEELMRKAPLRVLPLSPEPLELLERLGIETVGSFLDLPEEGVAKRFGREAQGIFRWAQRERLPIQSFAVQKNACISRRFDDAISSLIILTASVDELIEKIEAMVRDKQRLIASLVVELFEGEERRASEEIRPAAPTLDVSVLKGLCRLRLAGERYEGAVDRVVVSVEEIDPLHTNGDLFASVRRQAKEAGRRAFALIRARFGNDAIRHVVLHDEHLPDQRFSWERAEEPLFPVQATSRAHFRGEAPSRDFAAKGAGSGRKFRVVRRFVVAQGALPESLQIISGPFLMSGKWWHGDGPREYYFARDHRGGILWFYREVATGNLVLQGLVD